jgi:hypothetical protein
LRKWESLSWWRIYSHFVRKCFEQIAQAHDQRTVSSKCARNCILQPAERTREVHVC